MTDEGKLARFDAHIPKSPQVNPWQPDGTIRCDIDLLETLLAVAVGTSQQSGVVAGAADVWAAEELRRAGFHEDDVWPRRRPPRVMPRDIRNFVSRGLTRDLRDQVERRFGSSGAKQALPSEAHVMGRAYTKQSDVVIASWAAGVEVLISTKTMLSSYSKNLRNRFEEAYGDAKNLRGRHPLAALGFLFVVGADIPDSGLDFARDMLIKLTAEPDVYDCACLLVIDSSGPIEEADTRDNRPAEAEPPALLNLSDDAPEDELAEDVPGSGEEGRPGARVSVLTDPVPPQLSPDAFFTTLVTAALDRMPVAVYQEVRNRRAAATNGA